MDSGTTHSLADILCILDAEYARAVKPRTRAPWALGYGGLPKTVSIESDTRNGEMMIRWNLGSDRHHFQWKERVISISYPLCFIPSVHSSRNN
jgi:hypothetical protein